MNSELANQTLHQTPDTWAVPAGAGGGAGELVVSTKYKENEMDVLAVKKMSRIERLQAMETLWDSILYEDGQIESPEWHNQILEERKSIISSGKAKFISLSELKASRK